MKKEILIGKLLFPSPPQRGKNTAQLEASFKTLLRRQQENAPRLPDLKERKERLRRVREASLNNHALLEEALANLRQNGIKVVPAETPGQVMEALLAEVGGEKLVVKSKSNISKELHITEKLAQKGVTVVETDIGDRIIQLARERPSHPTGPATHLDRRDIARILARELGRKVPAEPGDLIEALTGDIKEAVARAQIGISGANALCAREGALLIIHNEGNISEISRLPGKHIILTDSAKLYPDLEEALNMVKIQTYCATGALTTSYMNIIAGLSKTADIEKRLFYGIHGPSQTTLVLYRRKNEQGDEAESRYCIGCGNCLLECPVYLQKGSAFGAYYRQGGIGVVQSALNEGLQEAMENGLYTCLQCGRCALACPLSLDTPGLMGKFRERAAAAPELKNKTAPYRKLAATITLAAGARALLGQRKNGGETAYFPGCIAALNTPALKKETIDLLSELEGAPPRVIAGCCGGVWNSLGYGERYEQTFAGLLERLRAAPPGRLIISCPHCYEILWLRHKDLLREAGVGEVLAMSEFLRKRGLPGQMGGGKKVRAVFHDSCLFGRQMGRYDEPRELLLESGAVELAEMEHGRERTRCCGFYLSLSEPGVFGAISGKIIAEARDAGAELLISSDCPGCYCALRDKGMEVDSLSGFILKRIKAAG